MANIEFSEYITSAMQRKNITPYVLAIKADLDHDFLRRVLAGERIPSNHTLPRICKVLDLDPAETQRVSSSTKAQSQFPELFTPPQD